MLSPSEVKQGIRKILRRWKWDVVRYNAQSSSWAALMRMFSQNKISVVLDVGANEGQYARMLRENGFDGRIVSFEPLTDAHQSLTRLAAQDPLWVVPPPTAMGEHEGNIKINVSQSAACSSILPLLDRCTSVAPHAAYVGTQTAAITTLDKISRNFVNHDDRIFLKIDVQGYEKQVIQGAKELLPSIVGVQVESSLVQLYDGETCFIEHLEYLTQAGFDFWSVIPGLVDENSGRMLQVDSIFFRPQVTGLEPRRGGTANNRMSA